MSSWPSGAGLSSGSRERFFFAEILASSTVELTNHSTLSKIST